MCFRWLAKMAVRLAARVQIPIKQSSSQLTTAPWRPQQKSEADRIQQKLHKKISLGVADADVSCLSVSVCVCVRQWEADLFQFCDYWWLLILKIHIKKLFEPLISNSWLKLFDNGGNVRRLMLSMWQNSNLIQYGNRKQWNSGAAPLYFQC